LYLIVYEDAQTSRKEFLFLILAPWAHCNSLSRLSGIDEGFMPGLKKAGLP